MRVDVKHGADVIKCMATAGVLSEEEAVGAPQYSQAEMNAVVDEAHMWGRKVAAHAHGAEAIKRAIRAGVDSVEHCSFIDDEGIRLAKEHGTYLVMDIYNDDYILAEYAKLGVPQEKIEKEKQVGRMQRENFRKAVQAGVKMAFGTDAGVYPHGENAQAVRQDGGVGHDADAGDPLGHRATPPISWAGGTASARCSPAATPTSSPSPATRSPTSRVLEHVQFVMKGGVVDKQK